MRTTLSPSHWSGLYNTSPDKIQGLLFVYASRMTPFPVQKVPFIWAAEILWWMAEVALGSRSKQVSITITMCSQICLLNVVLIYFTVIREQGALICWSRWKYHIFLVILIQGITNGLLLWRPLADVGGKEFMVVTILENTVDTWWEPWRCLMSSYKWATWVPKVPQRRDTW